MFGSGAGLPPYRVMSSMNADESKQRFEAYYDSHWAGMHEYFRFHRTRFLHSYEFLHPFVEFEATIADFVQPGDGPGPLAGFFNIERKARLELITTDLRKQLNVPDAACDLVLCTETIGPG